MGVVENKLRKLQISQNEFLHITSFTCVFSIPVKLKFIFSQTAINMVFPHWTLKLLNFLLDSLLITVGKLPNSLLKLHRAHCG